jgi:heterodisulfide reductase subunit A-like polyferredoxin
MLELHEQADTEIATHPDGKPEGRPIVKAADVLANRQVQNLGMTAKGLQEAAGHCLRCACGEGCGVCADLCCEFAISYDESNCITIDPNRCVACGMCYNRCPDRNIRMFNTGEKL